MVFKGRYFKNIFIALYDCFLKITQAITYYRH
jgi:hypothetical protein